MSFVYIDSQDREVNIPSVDAVRLRIELGAIKDQTRFFDSNTGKWAPAAEHEIYRTLKRQLMEVEQGFVAPPPPAVSSEGSRAPEVLVAEVEAPEAEAVAVELDDSFGGHDSPDAAAASETDEVVGGGAGAPSQVAREEPVMEEFEGFGDLELLPAEESAGDAAGADPEEGEDLWEKAVPDRDRQQGSAEGATVAGISETSGPTDAVDAADGADVAIGGGDDGAQDGGDEAPEQPETAAHDSFVTSVEDELIGEFGSSKAPSTLDDQAMDLEPSLADSFSTPEWAGSEDFGALQDHDGGDGADSGLAASWAQDQGASGEPSMQAADAFDSVWDSPDDHLPSEPDPGSEGSSPERDPFAEEWSTEEEPAGAREGAPPPQRKLTKARTPGVDRIVGTVALVAALATALFFGWRFLAPTLGPGSGESEIVMPPLDQELVPRMRQLAGRASGRMVQDMLALPERSAVPEEPSEDWLAGIYLAGASQYPDVPEYWSAIREWVQAAQTSENALFREALKAQLDTANLAASGSEAIRDRALTGFQAAGSDRLIVYNQMLEVAERSIELHQFLLANEEQVSYEPAGSGVSRDPVLEAVPTTEALGDEMWERVAYITNAMDALGYLDRIDTERLVGVFLEKLEATAIH